MSERFAFGPFVLDVERGTLRRHGTPVPLSHKGVVLLAALLAGRGAPVAKAALMEAAWPGIAVEESNLTVQIAALRKHLGAAGGSEDWIATVPRVGYRFAGQPEPAGANGAVPQAASARPAIAVLPFTNMSSDAEQEFFADGLAEDLITDLSKVRGLTVIARNSSFAYKGKPADIRTIARELGVRFVIEGSVRRAADRVRISAQLIDAVDGSHLWADRFDRQLADVFLLQDEVVGRILAALAPVLPADVPLAPRRPHSLEAYDLYVPGRLMAMQSPEGGRAARFLLDKAATVEPGFSDAHAWLAMSHHFGWLYWREPVEPHRALARAAAQRAVELDPQNANAHWILGYVRAYDGHVAEGIVAFETALALNPNHADAWALFSDLKVLDGRIEEATAAIANAFRLNPHPPGVYHWLTGWVCYAARQYEETVTALRHETAQGTGARRLLASALAQLGRMDEARREADAYLAAIPHFSVSEWARTQPFRDPADRAHYAEGMLKSGLPP